MESSLSEMKDDYKSLTAVKYNGDVTLYQWNGFWYRLPFLEAAKQIQTQFKPDQEDVILASFPKTGTTWLKTLLYSIMNPSSRDTILTTHPHLLVPTLEIQLYGQQANPFEAFASTKSSPRIFATHLPYEVMSNIHNTTKCRVVYITRNPKDTLISLWHFLRKSKTYDEPWPLEDLVEKFCDGKVTFGPYFEHVLGYKRESLVQPNKVFFITYEELKSDCKVHMKRLASFLGRPFQEDEEDVLDEIVSMCSFEKISHFEVNKSNDVGEALVKVPLDSFFRQGEVGDYKNYLNDDMIKRIDKTTANNFYASGFMYGI